MEKILERKKQMDTAAHIEYCLRELEVESVQQFGDEEKQKVAAKCLKHINVWMIESYQSGVAYTRNDRRRLKRDCFNSVKESVIKEYQEEYGFAILSFLLIYVVLPMVLKWLIERLFNKLK